MSLTDMNVTGYYNGYQSQVSNASVNALENTLGKVGEDTTEEELMSACKEFEAYFIEQIYKGMEKTIMKAEGDDSSGGYMDYFKDMQTQEYAKLASEQGNGIGLASQLYEQMKRNYGL
mgnify:FL=1